MRLIAAIALAMLLSIPAYAQGAASCKAYFQVLRAESGTPGLSVGMDSRQKSWWDGVGQKKYAGLCLDGSVTRVDKPRYLVIWSKSKSIGQATLQANEVYGQTASFLQTTAPKAWIYQPRWNMASVSIVSVLYNAKTQTPPVYLSAGDRAIGIFWPDSPKVLEVAVKFIAQDWEPVKGAK